MKFLLFPIGLACCIVGLFFRKDAERKIKSNIWIALGASLILVNLGYLWGKIVGIILAVTYVGYTIYYKGEKYFNSEDLHDDNLKWGGYTIVFIVLILFFSLGGRNLPSVTFDNDVIRMGGSFGRSFNISDIKLVDIASVYPRIGYRRGGSAMNGTFIGNFEMENENMMAKLCIYRDNPPYIKIRMNDNSLFILNFKEPDKTIEFYQQLKNAL